MQASLHVRRALQCAAGQMQKCMVARIENSSEICTKTRLAENMQRYAAAHSMFCGWIPETYIITCGAKGESRAKARPSQYRSDTFGEFLQGIAEKLTFKGT